MTAVTTEPIVKLKQYHPTLLPEASNQEYLKLEHPKPGIFCSPFTTHAPNLQFKIYSSPAASQEQPSHIATLAKGRPQFKVQRTSTLHDGVFHRSASEHDSDAKNQHLSPRKPTRTPVSTNSISPGTLRSHSHSAQRLTSPTHAQPPPVIAARDRVVKREHRSKVAPLTVFPTSHPGPLKSAAEISPKSTAGSPQSPTTPRKRAFEFDGVVVTKRSRPLPLDGRRASVGEPISRIHDSQTQDEDVGENLPSTSANISINGRTSHKSNLADALTAVFENNDQLNKGLLSTGRQSDRLHRKPGVKTAEGTPSSRPPPELLPPPRSNVAAAKEYWDTIDTSLNTRAFYCGFSKRSVAPAEVMNDRRLRQHLQKHVNKNVSPWSSLPAYGKSPTNPIPRPSEGAMIKYRTEELYGRGSMHATRPANTLEQSATDAARHED